MCKLSEIRQIRGFGDSKISREWYRLKKSLGLANSTSYIREKGWRFYPELLSATVPCYLKGHWISERYFNDQEIAIRQDFSFRKMPTGINAELVKQISDTPDAISIHVRRGDYLTSENKRIYASIGPEYYKNAIATIRDRFRAPRFFCFSDDPQGARNSLNLPTDTVFVDHNSSAGHEDLRLMTFCKHHIIANSTFSWWGAWLANPINQVVIAPDKWWIHPDYDDRDIIPERWLKISNTPSN